MSSEENEAEMERKEEENPEESDPKDEEMKVEEVEEPQEEVPTPAPTPSRRGGNRRSRKKRGGRRPAATSREPPVVKTEKEEDKEAFEVKTGDGEIEVTQDKTENEIKKEESEEERDPSPVMTRRSNRKIQQQNQPLKMEEEEAEEIPPEEFEKVKEEEQEIGLEMMDQDEVESVTSELDSVASGSTLTTRSRRRGGANSQDHPTKGRKGSKMGGKKSSTNGNGSLNGNGATSTKGKSRRIIFKKSATRAPTAVARAVTSDRVYYKGQYFTKGDIVSVEDVDGSVYYAQLRGFLTDQYCEKSGVITWLLPTLNSPRPEEGFDASTYVIGPEEDLPRKLDYFTFVMHAPDDYFFYKKAPYPTTAIQADQEYLVTRQGPRVRVIKAGRPVYQDSVPPSIPLNS